MRKLLLFILITFLAQGLRAQTGGAWYTQNTAFVPASSGVRYISAVDTNVLWICSYDGSGGGAPRQDYSRTVDGGANWVSGTPTGVPATYDWAMIHGVNADSAWAMYFESVSQVGGGIWRTTDGGANWTQQGVGTMWMSSTSFPDIVHMYNGMEGFAIGDPDSLGFEIYTTIDGGNNWQRVDSANIALPAAGEFGIVGHYCVLGDQIWFDTNKGYVYRSVDRGLHWTKAYTSLAIPSGGAMDLAFSDAAHGLARLYAAAGTNIVKQTSDSGKTWTARPFTGTLFGSDFKYIPGTVNEYVSTGAATGHIGTSFSYDGGATWITNETANQRSALGVIDTLHMWTGGFTTDPTTGGIYVWKVVPPVLCTDVNISAGNDQASSLQLCGGDTTTITTTGILTPTVGDFAGSSWVISTADISGSTDPLNDPSFVTSYTFFFPSPSTTNVVFVNDASFIGSAIPYGVYYWTPVVFGNGSMLTSPPQFLQDLILDPQCTYSGISIAVNVLDPNDALCNVGINELVSGGMSLHASQENSGMIDIRIESKNSGHGILQVMDMTGRAVYASSIVLNGSVQHEKVSAQQFAAGTYMIKLEMNGHKAVNKLVIY